MHEVLRHDINQQSILSSCREQAVHEALEDEAEKAVEKELSEEHDSWWTSDDVPPVGHSPYVRRDINQ